MQDCWNWISKGISGISYGNRKWSLRYALNRQCDFLKWMFLYEAGKVQSCSLSSPGHLITLTSLSCPFLSSSQVTITVFPLTVYLCVKMLSRPLVLFSALLWLCSSALNVLVGKNRGEHETCKHPLVFSWALVDLLSFCPHLCMTKRQLPVPVCGSSSEAMQLTLLCEL